MIDKAQEVDAKVSNVTSSVSVKVQVIKNMPIEHNGQNFTLAELFDATLEHPKWELKEIDGSKYILVTGGIKESLFSEGNSDIEENLTHLVDELITITFVFPFSDNKVLPVEGIAAYSNVSGMRMEENAQMLLVYLYDLYVNSKEKVE